MFAQVIQLPFLFIRRLKKYHKSCGSYAFILEKGAATNNNVLVCMTAIVCAVWICQYATADPADSKGMSAGLTN
jgi:hypothetical protein